MDTLFDTLKTHPRDRYAGVAAQLQQERQDYLRKVANGRRVAREDPNAPQFSQAADDERQARMAGLGDYLPFREAQPPAPAAPDVPVAPPPPRSVFDAILGPSPFARMTEYLEDVAQRTAPYNPFAGGVQSPVGRALGTGLDAYRAGRSAIHQSLQEMEPFVKGVLRRSGPSSAPADRLPLPGYNADENSQLQRLERGE